MLCTPAPIGLSQQSTAVLSSVKPTLTAYSLANDIQYWISNSGCRDSNSGTVSFVSSFTVVSYSVCCDVILVTISSTCETTFFSDVFATVVFVVTAGFDYSEGSNVAVGEVVVGMVT